MSRDTESPKIDRRTLTETGARVTNQRALILDIIRQGRGHLDADEVYHQARKKQPQLSLSTVYRSLQLFKNLGLVEEVHFDETHHHYEIKSSAEHHHLICLGCGKVLEFECELSPRMKEEVAHDKGFEVTGVEVHMSGYCSQCQQSMK